MTRKALLCFLLLGLVLIGSVDLAEALTLEEKLGGLIYRDTNLSVNFNQSCMTCHHPSAGFADPANRKDPVNFPVSEGSEPGLFGGRNAPTSAYAGFSPVLSVDGNGVWSGGMFWDGRATGKVLGDPLAEQAQGPFKNPVEMGLTEDEVVKRVAASSYANLFLKVYPDADFANVADTYNKIAKAIAAFERSDAVTRFTSKFDEFYLACKAAGIDVSAINLATNLNTLPQGILTTRQLKGLALFNDKDKGNCSACHSTKEICDPKDPDCISKLPPLFTDFTYDNLGIPTNWRVYELAGGSPPDLGLGGFLNLESEYGKFKVPTLRNVAMTPPYGHNGYFATLAGIVNFHNTRDVKPMCTDLLATEAQALAAGCWPVPDYLDTVNETEVGDQGLTTDEEYSLVVFMQSLTDRQR